MELVSTCYFPLFLFILSLSLKDVYGCAVFELQKKILILDELAEMPSCNFVEMVHNKWL